LTTCLASFTTITLDNDTQDNNNEYSSFLKGACDKEEIRQLLRARTVFSSKARATGSRRLLRLKSILRGSGEVKAAVAAEADSGSGQLLRAR
jgi:hypothetical protein